MRKISKLLVIVLLTITTFVAIPITEVSAAGVNITIDGDQVIFTQNSGQPFIDSAYRTQVPLRVTMEAYGCTVDWNNTTRTATVQKNGTIVNVPIGQKYIIINGINKTNDTAALIKDDRTYLPIRAVLEAFGANVQWDSVTQTVIIAQTSKVLSTAKEIFNSNSESIVFIAKTDYVGDEYTATGFIYTNDGKIITNYHVIENAKLLEIFMSDGVQYSGSLKVIAFSKEKDIAILKTDMVNTQHVTIANSDTAEIGDEVITIGNPLGLQNTLSTGLISSIREGLFQITAPISPGSSGGVLLNMYGECIGITSSGYTEGENLGFAIPINEIDKLSFANSYTLSDLFGSSNYSPTVSVNTNISLDDYQEYLNENMCFYTTRDNAYSLLFNYLITENDDGSITVGGYCADYNDKSELFDIAGENYYEDTADTFSRFAYSIYQDTGRPTSVILVLDDHINNYSSDLTENAIYTDTLSYDNTTGQWLLWFPILQVTYDGSSSSSLWFFE